MIERTRRKFDEARFFYGRLVKEHQRRTSRHDPSAFGYYLSAFIQAARGVTWRLGNEEPKKWKAWRPKWEKTLSDEDKKLLRFTNKLRTAEVKHGGTDLFVELEEVEVRLLMLRSEDFELERQHPAYGHHVFAPPGTPLPKVFRPTYYFEHEGGKEAVTALCKRYLDFLEKVLNDFCADTCPGSKDQRCP
jgi:hypothetical protein